MKSAARGVTLLGLLFWALLVGFTAYVAVRVAPAVSEYYTVQRAAQVVADSAPTTVADARAAFDRQKEVDYAISSLSGKDLDITKENGRVVVGFSYAREVPLFGPVNLLLRFEGRSK